MRKGGLEPPRPKALPPQGSVSTNSTTTAAEWHSSRIKQKKKGLYKITRQFLLCLVNFQAMLLEQRLLCLLFLDYKSLLFVSLQTQPA